VNDGEQVHDVSIFDGERADVHSGHGSVMLIDQRAFAIRCRHVDLDMERALIGLIEMTGLTAPVGPNARDGGPPPRVGDGGNNLGRIAEVDGSTANAIERYERSLSVREHPTVRDRLERLRTSQ
jgi:hypothetical protein